jgi:spore germination cell wall hydrolase CwlJ-like protein
MSLINLPKSVLVTLILLFGLTLSPMTNTVSVINLIPMPKMKVDAIQLKCLTNNIYFEAANQGLLGMAAVARVVMNRVAHGFASTPCKVVQQITVVEDKKVCQFSWVCEGKTIPIRDAKYRQAEQVAYDVMVNNRYSDILPRTALFFHNTTVDPMWPYKKVATIGNHIFYSKTKNKNDHQ